MTRRRLLRRGALAGAVALAGCLDAAGIGTPAPEGDGTAGRR